MMVAVKLYGGLGNQMFQYAAARSCSETDKIYLDISALTHGKTDTKEVTLRTFGLGIFPNIKSLYIPKALSHVINGDSRAYRLFNKLVVHGVKVVNDHSVVYPITAYNSGRIYLDGYFQNERYFMHNRESVLKQFRFPSLPSSARIWLESIQTVDNAVSIHIRRGDYLKPHLQLFHGTLGMEYYFRATMLMSDQLKDPHYFIFSDDCQWCADVFRYLENKMTIVETKEDAWVEMALMSQCKHHIIANSSFSWWAAWLNPDNKKKIIAPAAWYGPQGVKSGLVSPVPDNWTKI